MKTAMGTDITKPMSRFPRMLPSHFIPLIGNSSCPCSSQTYRSPSTSPDNPGDLTPTTVKISSKIGLPGTLPDTSKFYIAIRDENKGSAFTSGSSGEYCYTKLR